MPHMGGRVTHSAAATATAASKALPPSWRAWSPAEAARGDAEQTMPRLVMTALRVDAAWGLVGGWGMAGELEPA